MSIDSEKLKPFVIPSTNAVAGIVGGRSIKSHDDLKFESGRIDTERDKASLSSATLTRSQIEEL